MTEQELKIRALNWEITEMLAKKKPNLGLIIALRHVRDTILADYAANGGKGWFGNA